MQPSRAMTLAAVCTGVLAGCGSDSTGIESDIVGTWHATRFEFVNNANPANTVEAIALGASVTIIFNANHTFSLTLTLPGQPPEVSTGTYVVTATTLTITVTSETPVQTLNFTMSLSGNTLTLTGGATTFDFGTGEVAATINVTATR